MALAGLVELGGGLGVSGGAVLLFVLLVVALAVAALRRRVPRGTVLEMDLSRPPAAEQERPPALLRGNRRLTLREVVEALERAADDPRIAGVVAHLDRPVRGLADAEELHTAVGLVRQAGKRTVVHARSLGGLSSGTAAYHVASAFEEVVLQPSGTVGVVGLALEPSFVGEALDRLGVLLQVERRWEYKSAAERFTERRLSPPAREAFERLLASQLDRELDAIATGRGLERERVQAVIDGGPLTAEGAVEAGLVDALGYRDEAVDRACAGRQPSDRRLLGLERHRARRRPRLGRRAPAVAVVSCTGLITAGRGRLPLAATASADAVGRALGRARQERDIRAIVLRVDSRGGSYIASDAIWREVVRARDAGTPVVASMGNVAASGGYFVAAAADRIVAQPTTITGSIGVIAGKAVLEELQSRLGITTDAVRAGEEALIGSSARPWNERQRGIVADWMDRAYEDFTGKVAAGRGLSPERVDEVARGRIWSGADAARNGLVDRLGGHREALEEARELLGLAGGAPLRTVALPSTPSLRARVRGEDGGERGDGWSMLGAALPHAGPYAELLALAGHDDILALADVPGLR